MRFNSHLNEDNVEPPQELFDALKKNCMPVLKDIKKRINKTNLFLFRGMTGVGYGGPWAKKTVRQDRRPLDSTKRWHNDLGAGFKRKFGIDAREKGLFCSAFPSHQYGKPYLVFPISKYYCIWSDYVSDATEEEPDMIYDYMSSDSNDDVKAKVKNSIDKHVDKLMASYYKGSLDKAIVGVEKSFAGVKTEITVITNQYYYVSLNYQVYLEAWIRDEI